jgi:hypothetical protein
VTRTWQKDKNPIAHKFKWLHPIIPIDDRFCPISYIFGIEMSSISASKRVMRACHRGQQLSTSNCRHICTGWGRRVQFVTGYRHSLSTWPVLKLEARLVLRHVMAACSVIRSLTGSLACLVWSTRPTTDRPVARWFRRPIPWPRVTVKTARRDHRILIDMFVSSITIYTTTVRSVNGFEVAVYVLLSHRTDWQRRLRHVHHSPDCLKIIEVNTRLSRLSV